MKIVILLGAPGAGKGTVAARVATGISARHISTGAMLRDAVAKGTPAGTAAKTFMDKGELVPDNVLVDMVDELLAAAASEDILLLDGFPRTLNQARSLETLVARHNVAVDLVVYLDVPESVIMERLCGRRVCSCCGAVFHITTLPPKQEGICDLCGSELIIRDDDKPETIHNRLLVYEKLTAPLVAMYNAENKLVHVNGVGTADDVAESVAAILKR